MEHTRDVTVLGSWDRERQVEREPGAGRGLEHRSAVRAVRLAGCHLQHGHLLLPGNSFVSTQDI